MDEIKADIATIKADVRNLITELREFKGEQKKMVAELEVRVGLNERTISRYGERMSMLTVFQTGLSTIIGAIAAYLGINR